ncbi:hypothetical protein [Comamonas sp.]|uniref:hypothetical protein n=1 Tax=Comamonas sp. TaxID=34028 RepID=UPI003A95BCC7
MGSPVDGKRKARSVAGLGIGEELGTGPGVKQLASPVHMLSASFYLVLHEVVRCVHRMGGDVVQLYVHRVSQMFKRHSLGQISQVGCHPEVGVID